VVVPSHEVRRGENVSERGELKAARDTRVATSVPVPRRIYPSEEPDDPDRSRGWTPTGVRPILDRYECSRFRRDLAIIGVAGPTRVFGTDRLK
jgi:hypothetical protein